jgi:hypothetical protein
MLADAERRVSLQAWQLRKLVPAEGRVRGHAQKWQP